MNLCLLLLSLVDGLFGLGGYVYRTTGRVPTVVIVRRAGLSPYQLVAEEFSAQLRADVRVLSLQAGKEQLVLDQLSQANPALVFAIGQSAYDLLHTQAWAPLVYTYVYRGQTRRDVGVNTYVRAASALAAFRAARPKSRRIALLYGPTVDVLMKDIERDAKSLQIELVKLRAKTPSEALRLMRRMASDIDGLWLVPNVDVLTAQVVQYAVALQFRRKMPLLGATRRHVVQGALFAMDFRPQTLGRRAANIARRLLAQRRRVVRGRRRRSGGNSVKALPTRLLYGPGVPRLSLNHLTARRIGVDPSRLGQTAGVIR